MADPSEVDLRGMLEEREAEEEGEQEREDREQEREVSECSRNGTGCRYVGGRRVLSPLPPPPLQVAKRLEEEFRDCDLDLVEDDSFAVEGASSSSAFTPRAQPAAAQNKLAHFLTSTPFAGGISIEEGVLGETAGDTPASAAGGKAVADDEKRYLQASK